MIFLMIIDYRSMKNIYNIIKLVSSKNNQLGQSDNNRLFNL